MKKLTSAAVIGKVRMMSKLAPWANAMIPIVEAAMSASQFASELVAGCSLFVASRSMFLPRIHKLAIVASPKSADPNLAEIPKPRTSYKP